MNPSASSNRTQLKNSHKAMKVKRRLESIINVPGQQSVGRLNSLLSCKELQSVYTEYTVLPAERLKFAVILVI